VRFIDIGPYFGVLPFLNSSARHSKHSPTKVRFLRFWAAMAYLCKIQDKGGLGIISVIFRRCAKTHKTPTWLHVLSAKKVISQKIRRASGMLVSAVALLRGRVSGLVGGYMYRQRTLAVATWAAQGRIFDRTRSASVIKKYDLGITC
jgi:hypothetical protein